MPAKYRKKKKIAKAAKTYSAWLLYTYSLPILMAVLSNLLKGNLIYFLISSGVFFTVLLGAYWMSLGLRNKAVFSQREYKLNSPFPLMFVSSLLLGAASFVGSWLVTDYDLFSSIGFAIAATVGCWLWYGLDPIEKKSKFSDDKSDAMEILSSSEDLVLNIENHNLLIANAELSQRLDKITVLSRDVLKVLSENPNKLSKARRFLHSYLGATESVIERYAKSHDKTDDQDLDDNFKTVLQNIEKVFAEQYEKLLANDIFDLDVDIEVLNTLLEKQGIN
ncbi:MAG: 5-bromo-4-chloroindolyl phosphate hydrolysis family protein [Proteobacteria bacterium]|nr:5-bromo-4-chloroindolyl phosphate hydrolysis family protein [Pseudomonadota bacterium]